jgi:hypothetical protein
MGGHGRGSMSTSACVASACVAHRRLGGWPRRRRRHRRRDPLQAEAQLTHRTSGRPEHERKADGRHRGQH